MNPKALIITGYGLNCEAETEHALRLAGAEVDRIHLNDLIAAPECLANYHLLMLIGGFSYGDHIAAGRAFAIRLKFGLHEHLTSFVAGGGLVMGICNGFQTLCKLGLLPGFGEGQLVTLTHNDSSVFRDDWVRLRVNPNSPCVFTKGIDVLDLPIRHGEGKFLTLNADVLSQLMLNGQIAYQYCDANGEPTQDFPANPNGSVEAIAGICDPSGRIFGTMPHPEAAILPEHHPDYHLKRELGETLSEGPGFKLFQNAVDFIREQVLV